MLAMVPAPDHEHKCQRRWLSLGLVVATCIGQAGCAGLNPFRKADPPAFGTDTVSREGNGNGKPIPAGRDLYAETVGRPRADTEPVALAEPADVGSSRDRDSMATSASSTGSTRRTAGASSATEIARNGGGKPVSVTLQPPIALPAFSSSVETVAAEVRRTNTGWQPETHARTPVAPVSRETNQPPPTVAATPARVTVDTLLAESRKKLDSLSSYQVKMNHQERVNSILNPAEDVVLSIRLKPKAVRIEWQDGSHKGREVLYASDANGGLMHVRMAESLISLPRLSMAPDSPLALRNGRHPITEAGLDTVIVNMEEALRKQKQNDASGGKLAYAGLEKPEGVDKPCHKITRVSPEGDNWIVYLDPETHLPAYVQETASNGDLLERYVFRGFTPNVAELAKAEAFDPDARWGPPKGLLQRLARSPGGGDDSTRSR